MAATDPCTHRVVGGTCWPSQLCRCGSRPSRTGGLGPEEDNGVPSSRVASPRTWVHGVGGGGDELAAAMEVVVVGGEDRGRLDPVHRERDTVLPHNVEHTGHPHHQRADNAGDRSGRWRGSCSPSPRGSWARTRRRSRWSRGRRR